MNGTFNVIQSAPAWPPCPVECAVLQIGRDRQIGMGRGGIGGGILMYTLEAEAVAKLAVQCNIILVLFKN